MEEIFRYVIIMSCAGTAVYIVLRCLKPFTGGLFSGRWQYYIWILALILLIVPFRFKTSAERNVVFSDNGAVHKEIISGRNRRGELVEREITAGESSYNAENNIRTEKPDYFHILAYIWTAGTVLFLLGAAVSYIRFIYMVKINSAPAESDILEKAKQHMNIRRRIYLRKTDILDAPLMAGIIRPVLLIPDKDMSDEDLYYVFLHELTHFKRADIVYKWFAMAANALHWFNPFVYLIVREINEACEISCDILVTRNFSDEEKKVYMNTILKIAGSARNN